MNARDIMPTMMKVIPRPLRPSGTSEYFRRSRIAASITIARAQPIPGSQSIDNALGEGIRTLHHEQSAAEYGAVDRDQRQENTERPVQPGRVKFHRHFQHLYHCRNDADKRDQAQE